MAADGEVYIDTRLRGIDDVVKDIKRMNGELDRLDTKMREHQQLGDTQSSTYRKMQARAEILNDKMEKLQQEYSMMGNGDGAEKQAEQMEKLGKSTESASKQTEKVKEKADKVNLSFKKGFKFLLRYGLGVRSVFALVNKLRKALVDGFNNLAQFNNGMNPTNTALSNLKSSLTQLKNSFATAFAPILTVIEPILTKLISMLSQAVSSVGMFIAKLTGATTFTRAIKVQENYAKSIAGTGASAKKASKSLASYHELNMLNTNDSSGGGSGSVSPNQMFENVEIGGKVAEWAAKIQEVFAKVKEKVQEMWSVVQPILQHFKDVFVDRIWNPLKTFAGEFLSKLAEKVGSAFGKITKFVSDNSDKIKRIIDVGLMVWEVVFKFFEGVLEGFLDNTDNIIDHILQAFGGLIDFIDGVFTGDWEKAWNGIKDIFKGVFNLIIDIYEGAVNAIINGLNKISIDVPDWMPGIGGKTIGFNLEKLHLPRLATGTVVPRQSREFAAILGDNNRETEVVSPLSTMKQAMIEALSEVGMGGNTEVIRLLQIIAAKEPIDSDDLFASVRKSARNQFMSSGRNPLVF